MVQAYAGYFGKEAIKRVFACLTVY